MENGSGHATHLTSITSPLAVSPPLLHPARSGCLAAAHSTPMSKFNINQ